jgi:hypothetical protein
MNLKTDGLISVRFFLMSIIFSSFFCNFACYTIYTAYGSKR